jgi:hypothetical protein
MRKVLRLLTDDVRNGPVAAAAQKPQERPLRRFRKFACPHGNQEFGPPSNASHAVLEKISLPVAKRLKRDTPEGRAAVEQLVWSQIHGHAHLMIDGKLQREDGTGCEPFAAPLDLASVLLPE